MPAYVAGLGPQDTFAVLADAARTAGSLGILVCTWRAGAEPPPHSMPGTDQAFIVLAGACVLAVDGRELEAATGELVFVPRGSPVTTRVTEGPCRVLVVLAPAGPEAYLATASALPGISPATLIALAAELGVVIHPRF
jgi:quercetin dioxygenase-like cupin family protein